MNTAGGPAFSAGLSFACLIVPSSPPTKNLFMGAEFNANSTGAMHIFQMLAWSSIGYFNFRMRTLEF